ncbi:hypothetical protein G9A89_007660 [Geosiphon pyriformis]|nr:hypothetical protein G9A89_007660 [Geosiphon pyriformis]
MSYKTNQSSRFFSKASLITEPIAKIGDCVVILLKTEKLFPHKTSKELYAKEILFERILESILQAVSIQAIDWVFVRTPSHSYGLEIIETQASFQALGTNS